jgi:HK97 family phage prohead protease
MLAPNPEPSVASVFAARTTIEPDGTVEGYASLFGEIDQARDMVMRGAFAATLATRGIHRIPMLFQHDPAEPIGIWLELREDHRGLRARGRLIPEVARARELLSLLRAGAIDGLSIGFRTVQGRIDPKTRIRRLLAVDLWEISIVTFPLLAGARVRAVKQATSPPKPSFARTRAEREWAGVTSIATDSELSSPGSSPQVGSRRLAGRNDAQLGRARVAVRSHLGGRGTSIARGVPPHGQAG